MISKIFKSIVTVAITILISCIFIITGVLYQYFGNVQQSQLKGELRLAASATEKLGIQYLENLNYDKYRITWVNSDGNVLFDSHAKLQEMDNHGDREEIKEALETGVGSAVRTSATLTEQTYYEAKRLKDGTVLRISANQESAWALMVGMLWPIILIVVLAIFLSAFLARQMAKKIVEPLNELDLEHPLKNKVYEEISPLLQRIHRQHNQIEAQMEELRRKADEFSQITDSMQEGLVLLDSHCLVLSMNPAAKQLFGAQDDCVGKNFLSIDKSSIMRAAVNDVLDKGHGFARAKRNGRNYQFDLSCIKSDGEVIGAVVLAFDITEKLNSELMRREFSANVSHELKTPLQGIIGSTELIENGLVKSEYIPRFVGHIRKESIRLVQLIEDIIHLSQLDEGVELPMEGVDLYLIAEEVKNILQKSAEEKDITITVTGASFVVQGVRRMLHEIVYNLCDNAIKYNTAGGSVHIYIEDNCLSVSDNGIGISPEHQTRVFERFYRVDKSHSKASGGTGLGLSIVKHAVEYHDAKLYLDSSPGKGTKVTVQF